VSANSSINGMNITLGNNTTSTVGTLSFNSNYNGTIGALTLSANSIIDMGEDLSVVAAFASIVNLNDYILKVYNWDGSSLWGGGTGNDDDRLYFGTGVAGELDQISFYSGFGTGFLGTGFDLGFQTGFGNQIIPVPEPETWATGILLVLGSAVWLWRKRRNFTTQSGLEGAAPSAPSGGRAPAPIEKMVGLFRRNDPNQRQSRPHDLSAKSATI
jgi:hypothetical protein